MGSGSASFKAGPAAVALSGGFSREPDYLSIGGGGVKSLELAEKNVMPLLVAITATIWSGGPAIRWTLAQIKQGQPQGRGHVRRQSFDHRIVVVREIHDERGYLAKPYRYLPVVAPGVASQVPAGASSTWSNR